MNRLHKEILKQIQDHSDKPTKHTFLNSYLGTSHPRYAITVPALRKIAKTWMTNHPSLSATELSLLLTRLIKGDSSTEKCMAGILLDYATPEQRKFNPKIFNTWLNELEGWAEVDTLCTGRYSETEIPSQWETWKPLLIRFSKSKNIQKRRASIVLLCSPLLKVTDERMANFALQNALQLAHEKDILITKALSWVLRSMVKRHRRLLERFMVQHKSKLPKIAVRETLTKLKTGKKTK